MGRKLTFLEHSGFFLELDTCCLLFDYWKGDIPLVDKPYYIFASHAHHDHFRADIFELLNNKQATYILSDDISCNDIEHIIHIGAHEHIDIDQISVQTLASTDAGVAFLVHVEGLVIYHSGDLHWWHWDEENSDEENALAKSTYINEIERLRDIEIDLAFVVLDPRLDEQYHWGLDAFMRTTHAKKVFPMHFWGDFQAIDRLKKNLVASSYADRIMKIHHKQEEFLL